MYYNANISKELRLNSNYKQEGKEILAQRIPFPISLLGFSEKNRNIFVHIHTKNKRKDDRTKSVPMTNFLVLIST